MKVTTLRLPEGLYDDLSEEADDMDRSFSEYVRMLLRNREANTIPQENTPEHTPTNTNEYDDLRERLAALEDRVNELAAGDETEPRPSADNPTPEDGRSPGTNPHSQTVEEAVQWAKEHEPVQRADIIAVFEDDVDIRGESLWKRHIRDALKEAGFEHDRTGGIATWER